jgi:hypothetical protein
MKKVLLAFGILLLSACGYDGNYRYSCQDPENWETKECNPPLCNVDGACTETLLGFNPNLEELVNSELKELIPTQETVSP